MAYISRRHIRRFFNADAPLYAQCELVEGDKTYEQGEEFPWQELGLDERAVITLFRTRKLSHHPEGDILGGNPQEAPDLDPDVDDSDEPTDLNSDTPVDEEFDDSEEEADEDESSEEEDSDEE